MLQTLAILPGSFWVTMLFLMTGGVWAFTRIRDGIGLPVLAVLGTVAAWYVGDAIYNDYTKHHAQLFTPSVLENAWWQVAWFLVVFLILAPVMHGLINGRIRQRSSRVSRLMKIGPLEPQFQQKLNQLFQNLMLVWVVLVVIAFIRLGDQIPYFFFPFLSYRADPWGRARIGTGFDALLSVAGYFQILVAALFGLLAALARNGRVRYLALVACCLTWPSYIFDRTRNTLLAVVLPGILAWVFIRLRVGWIQKVVLLAVCFSLINWWLAFIIINRSNTTITAAVQGNGVSLLEASQEAHHEGLNMFEELCWINTFIADGIYRPNWGQRYFAEIVNPIPRALWHGKPMIGLDYAAVRGQSSRNGTVTDNSDVNATVSTGMIGQGVVNFGRVLGPAFAAMLMALWTAMLARLDLREEDVGSIPLYALGLILTFNLGRDITLITLYTFFFGMALAWWIKRRSQSAGSRRSSKPGR